MSRLERKSGGNVQTRKDLFFFLIFSAPLKFVRPGGWGKNVKFAPENLPKFLFFVTPGTPGNLAPRFLAFFTSPGPFGPFRAGFWDDFGLNTGAG